MVLRMFILLILSFVLLSLSIIAYKSSIKHLLKIVLLIFVILLQVLLITAQIYILKCFDYSQIDSSLIFAVIAILVDIIFFLIEVLSTIASFEYQISLRFTRVVFSIIGQNNLNAIELKTTISFITNSDVKKFRIFIKDFDIYIPYFQDLYSYPKLDVDRLNQLQIGNRYFGKIQASPYSMYPIQNKINDAIDFVIEKPSNEVRFFLLERKNSFSDTQHLIINIRYYTFRTKVANAILKVPFFQKMFSPTDCILRLSNEGTKSPLTFIPEQFKS